MTAIIMTGVIISLITIALFLFVGSQTKTGVGIFSFSRIKIPSWINWGNSTVVVGILLVGVLIVGFIDRSKIEHSVALIGENRMVTCTIPEIPPEFENKIIFTESWFIRSQEKNAVIYFPGATLIQPYRDPLDYKTKNKRLVGQVGKGLQRGIVTLAKDYELEFKKRRQHTIYTKLSKTASIGNVTNLKYKFVKKEEVEKK